MSLTLAGVEREYDVVRVDRADDRDDELELAEGEDEAPAAFLSSLSVLKRREAGKQCQHGTPEQQAGPQRRTGGPCWIRREVG